MASLALASEKRSDVMKENNETFTTENTENTEGNSRLNTLSERIIGCAIEVHRHLGPGLLESAYEACFVHELELAKIPVTKQQIIPLIYKGMQLDYGYRLDVVVDDTIICELKAIDRIEPIHQAQLLSYLKLTNKRLGLIINFNVKVLRNGIKRVIL